MTVELQEMYESINANYQDVLTRMMGREDLVIKYLRKFIDDENFAKLEKSMGDKDYEMMLMSAHTLKGVALNLGLAKLGEACSMMVTSLRNDKKELLDEQFSIIDGEYRDVIAKIKCL